MSEIITPKFRVAIISQSFYIFSICYILIFQFMRMIMKTSNRFTKSFRKDCLNQVRCIYRFDKNIDESFVRFLSKFGEVEVFRDFDIPLIRMDVPNKLRLVTLMNANTIDVFFKKDRPKNLVKSFEAELNKILR